MVCTSSETSYNALSHSHVINKGLIELCLSGGSGSGEGGGWSLIFRGEGVMQKRKFPDFRFPEAGISAKTNCMS